jgi:hypothetical protein
MIGLLNGARVWLACGTTDLRNGFDGLDSCRPNLPKMHFLVSSLSFEAGAVTA